MFKVYLNKLSCPFKNNRGDGDERESVAIIYKLIAFVIVASMAGWFASNLMTTAKEMQQKEAEIRQQQNQSIGS